ncbi:hypothetical protein ACCO45_005781 [Purpureocillium lilacinum]|uniref:Uncharacterized protein n=1 Tax=Purpureocillium lilacinum TaxID=33203 RepID=A0ACC4DWF0_PURLI
MATATATLQVSGPASPKEKMLVRHLKIPARSINASSGEEPHSVHPVQLFMFLQIAAAGASPAKLQLPIVWSAN